MIRCILKAPDVRYAVKFPEWPMFADILSHIGLCTLMTKNNKSTVLWDVIQCIPVKFHRRFGGTYCLQLQDLRYAEQAKSKKQENNNTEH
jgi:hypothetical protein